MNIYIGADHRGYKLKETLKVYLVTKKFEVIDVGGNGEAGDDYPDFAAEVGEMISKNPNDRGILICGTGVGVSIVANKFRGVRASLIFNVEQGRAVRVDEDANVLALPADYISEFLAKEIVDTWLATPFSKLERHVRRIDKLKEVEVKNKKYKYLKI